MPESTIAGGDKMAVEPTSMKPTNTEPVCLSFTGFKSLASLVEHLVAMLPAVFAVHKAKLTAVSAIGLRVNDISLE